jgi:ABC-type transport system involved in cytochrome c biogenesis permease component
MVRLIFLMVRRDLVLWFRDMRLWVPSVLASWSMAMVLGYVPGTEWRGVMALASHGWMMAGLLVVPWLWTEDHRDGVLASYGTLALPSWLVWCAKGIVMLLVGGLLPLMVVSLMGEAVLKAPGLAWGRFFCAWLAWLPWWGLMGAMMGRLLTGVPRMTLWVWVGMLPLTMPMIFLALWAIQGSLSLIGWCAWWAAMGLLGGALWAVLVDRPTVDRPSAHSAQG